MLYVDNLVKKYGSLTVLNGVTAAFDKGNCYLLLGENGAGKSTLAKCIAGDEKFNSGSIDINTFTANLHENDVFHHDVLFIFNGQWEGATRLLFIFNLESNVVFN